MAILAIDIGGTNSSVALVEESAVREQQTWPSPRHGIDALALLQERAFGLIGLLPVTSCGIGFGGQFDFMSQSIIRSVHVPGWEGFRPAEWALEVFEVPSVADNDANVGALGESICGAGRSAQVMVYLTISTGIGGGLVVAGKLQRGARSLSGEMGHVMLDPAGPECGCGLRGCAERMLSGLWLERDYGAAAESLFLEDSFIRDYAGRLATLLRQVTMMLDPDVIVLGGGIGASSDRLAELAQARLTEDLAPWQRGTPQVRRAKLGRNSVLIGAAHLAKERHGAS